MVYSDKLKAFNMYLLKAFIFLIIEKIKTLIIAVKCL